ncbi:putative chitinase [Caulobacter ginsengisoli]|uniref:Chitinase n=1 Tax=Caulobacter ginsengisoli TaxID=400775 RepID=A0ABU0IQ24_9CAUL|nr:glycoside hydrolase family 19 protein [Caulobacter ginsengisoli]MDQ0463052.1 putative chitinase [Caulobacter ginsengisoli]
MALTIDAASLKAFSPACDAAGLAPAFQAACDARQINTARRITHFLGQIYVESGGFTRLVENLNYKAARLVQVWPSRFPNIAAATPFAGNPEALANKVYGGRMGNTAPGDGWKYRGRGFIQLTGKSNYTAASTWSGLDLVGNPDQAAAETGAAQIAAAFWANNGLNAIADGADETAAIKAETLKINGGLNGLAERTAAITKAKGIWS